MMTTNSEWKMQREEVLSLIAAYKKLKCLWDFRSNEYKRYDLKKLSWQKLGNMFGKKPIEVKTKIKYLRSAYVSEKKKVDDSYGTGKVYRPNLFYYKDMDFLDSIVVFRKGPQFENYEISSEATTKTNEEVPEATLSECYVNVADITSPCSTPEAEKSYLKIRKPKRHKQPYYSKLGDVVNTLAEVAQSTTEESIYTAFANVIVLQLNQLPPLEATATMSEIHQILSRNIIKSLLSKKQSSEARVDHSDIKPGMSNEEGDSDQSNSFEEVSM